MSEVLSCLGSATTGIVGVVIWISAGEFEEGPERHLGPRILVVPGDRLSADSFKGATSVSLAMPPVVSGSLPAAMKAMVLRFVETNRQILLTHWSGELASKEVIERIQAFR